MFTKADHPSVGKKTAEKAHSKMHGGDKVPAKQHQDDARSKASKQHDVSMNPKSTSRAAAGNKGGGASNC